MYYFGSIIVFLILFVLSVTILSCCQNESYYDGDTNDVVIRLWKNKNFNGDNSDDYRNITLTGINTKLYFNDFNPQSIEVSPGIVVDIFYKGSQTSRIVRSVEDLTLYGTVEQNVPSTSAIDYFVFSKTGEPIRPLQAMPIIKCYDGVECQRYTRGYAAPEDSLTDYAADKIQCYSDCFNNKQCKSIFWGISPSGSGYCYHFTKPYGSGTVWRSQNGNTNKDSYTTNVNT